MKIELNCITISLRSSTLESPDPPLPLWSWMLPRSPNFPGNVGRDPHLKACQVLENYCAMTVISFLRVLKKTTHLNFRVSCLLTTHFHTSPLRQPFIWTQRNSLELVFFHDFLESKSSGALFLSHFLLSIFLRCSISSPSSLAVLPVVRFKCRCVGLIPIFPLTSLLHGSEMEFQAAWIMPSKAANACWGPTVGQTWR